MEACLRPASHVIKGLWIGQGDHFLPWAVILFPLESWRWSWKECEPIFFWLVIAKHPEIWWRKILWLSCTWRGNDVMPETVLTLTVSHLILDSPWVQRPMFNRPSVDRLLFSLVLLWPPVLIGISSWQLLSAYLQPGSVEWLDVTFHPNSAYFLIWCSNIFVINQ